MNDKPESNQPKPDPDRELQQKKKPKYAPVSEQAIQNAMKRHGLTREEVLEML